MTEPIDVERARRAALDIVTENPDEVNPTTPAGTCVYTHPDNPHWHCLGGAVLLALDLPLPGDNRKLTAFAGTYQPMFTELAWSFMIRLQDLADCGMTWQTAFDKTDALGWGPGGVGPA